MAPSHKTILIGISGGIAAYKVAELVSRLKKKGYQVEVIMTESARQLVAPLTFSTLSGRPVRTEMFHEIVTEHVEVEHISMADRADLMVIVPATANIIGKAANGIADDLLSTVIMAASCPVMYFPAMNTRMWEHPVLQENITKLRSLGYEVIDPDSGFLACGTSGKGRLGSIDSIEAKILETLEKQDKQTLAGKTVLVSAGPTREPVDPVRYLTNRSSGKMGYAIAAAASKRGAEVVLVSGPVSLPVPAGVKRISVETALEMQAAMAEQMDQADIVIMAAAVADYRVAKPATEKIKKDDEEMSLNLVKNPDILSALGARKGQRIVVGFAAETNDLKANALSKLKKKNLNMIVANDVTQAGAGFDADTNIAVIYRDNGSSREIPLTSKEALAEIILDEIECNDKEDER